MALIVASAVVARSGVQVTEGRPKFVLPRPSQIVRLAAPAVHRQNRIRYPGQRCRSMPDTHNHPGRPCLSVESGDTFTILAGNRRIKIRLWGIAAPHLDQPFGKQARAALFTKLSGRLAVEITGKDDAGMSLGRVTAHGTDVNLRMIKCGMAWWRRGHRPADGRLMDAEREANTARRGLWKDANATAPWMWQSSGYSMASNIRPTRKLKNYNYSAPIFIWYSDPQLGWMAMRFD